MSAVAARLDAVFYASQVRELSPSAGDLEYARHYLLRGAAYAFDPAPWFSGEGYLHDNEDVLAVGYPPFLHYVWRGEAEGRRVFASPAGARRSGTE